MKIELDPATTKALVGIYGLTDDPTRAGWILPDGRMLCTIPLYNGHRCHDSVAWLVPGVDPRQATRMFVDAGLIRHVIGHTAFEMGAKPTSAQMAALAGLMGFHGGETLLDLRDGDRKASLRFPIGGRLGALAAIRAFFEEKKP